MNPELVAQIYAWTALGVCIMLALAGLGSAIGWGLICSRYIEGIARQPELRGQLLGQTLFTGGLMESFPFIVFGVSMWFIFANPLFTSALKHVTGH